MRWLWRNWRFAPHPHRGRLTLLHQMWQPLSEVPSKIVEIVRHGTRDGGTCSGHRPAIWGAKVCRSQPPGDHVLRAYSAEKVAGKYGGGEVHAPRYRISIDGVMAA